MYQLNHYFCSVNVGCSVNNNLSLHGAKVVLFNEE
ncbi:hypothetical protein BACUNI_03649 [Bacteroides uniformis ATCC 8492]|uniref:Uncharacterized protein n=1 Tax=Bacteroides uniformis (strain ATCC 8492 / DSM 6597 / CCUG 4942 / CIP 103695 / JCM 5828 / KCTC 5204 / NCTC 13054 / VPI 0061) TaxID=411479 RepID=A0ABC9N7W3_BACUC|nr:hypothetical protein BACUNI_03649 [Bacteroides uniformis ATCC 8492]